VADYAGRFRELEEAFVDIRAGIATTVGVDITTSFCAVGSARFGCAGVQREEWSAGLTMSSERSKAVAVLEVLERYAGLRPRGRRTTVRAAYAELGDDAIDPRTLILYGEDQYARPRFPCVPFHDGLVVIWGWGWSFGRARPVLVPEQAAHYDASHIPRGELFLIESSSGCAIGGCLEEAIFYGLLEVIERDGVLHAWYDGVPPPQLDPASVSARDLHLIIDRLTSVSGYRLVVLDATREIGIPTIWAMAIRPDDPEHRALSASRTHPDAEAALAGALGELMGTLIYHRQQCMTRREELLAMLGDGSRVLDRLDHSLLGGLPEAFGRLSFLFEREAEAVPFAAAYPDRRPRWAADLAVAARELIARVIGAGYDVIIVDQTTPEQRDFGLSTVKVLVPGMLPMTYCTFMRRTPGPPANPWPHPFA
jgi:ribosomal protein S12 methylthiotransferase accessory factor